MDGIFNLCSNLFDISFEEIKDENTWHPDVQVYAITNTKTGEIQGHFYLDPFIREDKGKILVYFDISETTINSSLMTSKIPLRLDETLKSVSFE